MEDYKYVSRDGLRLRCGYTTGSCAALAAKAAAEMLLGQSRVERSELRVPKGSMVSVEVLNPMWDRQAASCAVRKDAGDDWDVTDGILIYAEVRRSDVSGFRLEGGEGIGRVTRPGLEQPMGSPAINRVPREMIFREVGAVCSRYGYSGGLVITVSAPQGAEIAAKTFNPRLGIEGGISILGTSGVVEPRSVQALIDTIETEIKVLAAAGNKTLILTPGNYGEEFAKRHFNKETLPMVQCSNYIGDALDLAAVWGFEQVLLVGHVGKLVKLAGGVMNTHSRTADCRAEIITAHAALAGAEKTVLQQLFEAATTDACIAILDEVSLRGSVMESLLRKIQEHLDYRAAGRYRAGAILFSNEYGYLGGTGLSGFPWEARV